MSPLVRSQRPFVARRAQRGVVMLIMFMILFLAGASVFLTVMNNNVLNQQQNSDAMAAMRDVRESLISYAVLYGDYYGAAGAGPGHLPCPDSNRSGTENVPCNATTLGRLPESIVLPSGDVFALSDYLAGIDEQIWYAVSPAFRRSSPGVVNTTTTGSLTVDGRAGIAAVLIAPGEDMYFQSRPNSNSSNYLEAGNDGGPNFVSNNPADPNNFNDRVLGLAAADILSPVSARVAEQIKIQLDVYFGVNGNYPPDAAEFAVAMGGAPAWFTANNWDGVTTYSQLSANTASVVFAGCAITYTLDQTTPNIGRTGTRC